jgi:hypothetical protein
VCGWTALSELEYQMHEFAPAAAVDLPPRRQNGSASLASSHTVKGSGLEQTAHQCNPGYRLRHLHMGITSGPVPVARPAAQTLHCTALHCTALESLFCYSDGNEAEGDKIQQLVTAKRGLLSLSCADQVISDAFLAAVAVHCPQLQKTSTACMCQTTTRCLLWRSCGCGSRRTNT